MNLQIISFEDAKKLKKLGFDWASNAFYDNNGLLEKDMVSSNYNCDDNINMHIETFSAPTQAGVVKYFRDIYDIHIQPSYVDFDTVEYIHITGYRLNIIFGRKVKGIPFNYILASEELTEKYYGGIGKGHGIVFETYEEAELEGIKVIEFLKSQK